VAQDTLLICFKNQIKKVMQHSDLRMLPARERTG
jgi:hypothetical protein